MLALAAFIGAIIFAQISNFVRPEDARKNLEKQSALTMREYIAETESGAEDAAFAFLVEGDRDLLEAYRHRTPQRLRFVTWASASQIAAIGILTAAVATLLLR